MMAARRELMKGMSNELAYAASLEKVDPGVAVVGVKIPLCCQMGAIF